MSRPGAPVAPHRREGDAGRSGLDARLVVRRGGFELDLHLTAGPGEVVALLGPNGAGKSTALRALAGLVPTAGGHIRVDGRDLRPLPPERRGIGMVFQDYLLFPHLSALENVAFGLRCQGMRKREARRVAAGWLEQVGLAEYASVRPRQLSGGQAQRVALARALAVEPSLLLLDEPLSNLDAKLRERARVWLRELQERLNVTTIYVTHDQAEALAVSDRIAVMSMGHLRQLGTPKEIYERPADSFVADFIGSSNFLAGRMVQQEASHAVVELKNGTRLRTAPGQARSDGSLVVAIRPERIEIVPELCENSFLAEIGTGTYLGSIYQYHVTIADTELRIQTARELPPGPVHLRIPPEATAVYAEAPGEY